MGWAGLGNLKKCGKFGSSVVPEARTIIVLKEKEHDHKHKKLLM